MHTQGGVHEVNVPCMLCLKHNYIANHSEIVLTHAVHKSNHPRQYYYSVSEKSIVGPGVATGVQRY